jgi:hypothetical protein
VPIQRTQLPLRATALLSRAGMQVSAPTGDTAAHYSRDQPGVRVDSKLLIDAIVRQTTILIAALSTAAGIRAPLAHVADQVFLELAREIESNGVSRKVAADMFGLALRTYQTKVQRLSESASERSHTLWQAVYQCVLDAGSLSRQRIEERFKRDPSADVAAVLHDLVQSRLVRAERHGDDTSYEIVSERVDPSGRADDRAEALAVLIWASVYRKAAVTVDSLASTLGAPLPDVQAAVNLLLADGRVRWNTQGTELRADVFVVPVGSARGWEAAVFHHFSTVAGAIAAKVQRGPGSKADDRVGGATLAFDLSDSHPHAEEVYGLLARVRADLNEVWNRVASHNRNHPIDDGAKVKVSFYFGQTVDETEGGGGDDAQAF